MDTTAIAERGVQATRLRANTLDLGRGFNRLHHASCLEHEPQAPSFAQTQVQRTAAQGDKWLPCTGRKLFDS